MMTLRASSSSNTKGAKVLISRVINQGVNFSNIPQIYRNLEIVGRIRGVTANTDEFCVMWFNGDITNLYTYTLLNSTGAALTSARNTPLTGSHYIGTVPSNNATSGLFGSFTVHIPHYTNSTTFKSCYWQTSSDRNGSGTQHLATGLYRSTSPITTISIAGANGTLTGSSFSLYGIRDIGQ